MLVLTGIADKALVKHTPGLLRRDDIGYQSGLPLFELPQQTVINVPNGELPPFGPHCVIQAEKSVSVCRITRRARVQGSSELYWR